MKTRTQPSVRMRSVVVNHVIFNTNARSHAPVHATRQITITYIVLLPLIHGFAILDSVVRRILNTEM